jgi:hypothetical protein
MAIPWDKLTVTAGIGQLALVVGSIAIPRILRWPDDLAKLRPLTRQVFWVYAGYIWSTNLAFGLVSAFAPWWLLDCSPLAGAVCAYIALYWGARLVIQFTCFDRTEIPKGLLFAAGEAVLIGLFLLLTLIYSTLGLRDFGIFEP